jgi:stalled ribosome alternative rescue factor ArfA
MDVGALETERLFLNRIVRKACGEGSFTREPGRDVIKGSR